MRLTIADTIPLLAPETLHGSGLVASGRSLNKAAVLNRVPAALQLCLQQLDQFCRGYRTREGCALPSPLSAEPMLALCFSGGMQRFACVIRNGVIGRTAIAYRRR